MKEQLLLPWKILTSSVEDRQGDYTLRSFLHGKHGYFLSLRRRVRGKELRLILWSSSFPVKYEVFRFREMIKNEALMNRLTIKVITR